MPPRNSNDTFPLLECHPNYRQATPKDLYPLVCTDGLTLIVHNTYRHLIYVFFSVSTKLLCVNQNPSALKHLTQDKVWVFQYSRIYSHTGFLTLCLTLLDLAYVYDSQLHCCDVVTQHNKLYSQACTVQHMFTTPNVFKHKLQIKTRPLDARTSTNPSKTKINLNFN
jgi:hypothetical protein